MDTRQARRERREADRKAKKQILKSERRSGSSATSSINPVAGARSVSKVPQRPHPQTGPRTDAGKARSSLNAFRHGLTSAKLVIPGENEDEFNALLAQLIHEHQPVTVTEAILVREMAEQYWRLQRVRNREHDLETYKLTCFESSEWNSSESAMYRTDMALYHRYAAAHERSFHRCLNTLRKLQKERRERPESEEFVQPDFVSQNTAAASAPAPFEDEFEFVTRESLAEFLASRPKELPPLPVATENEEQPAQNAA